MKELIELQKNLFETKDKLVNLNREYENNRNELLEQLDEISRQIRIVEFGLKIDYIRLAESVLSVYGSECDVNISVYKNLIDDAIRELAVNRGAKLKEEYFGIKIYDGFGPQRSDHPYGYGPTHGDIFFSVGLRDDAQKKDLTDEEIGAIIYYLKNIETIFKAKEYQN